MAILNHSPGFPRVGLRRELKKAQESDRAGKAARQDLLATGRELRAPLATAVTSRSDRKLLEAFD